MSRSVVPIIPPRRIFPAVFLSLAAVATVAAQTQSGRAPETTRTTAAALVAEPPVVDGRLDDPVWLHVDALSGFVQRELHEGEPVTERTEIRVVTDADAIYIGAWMYDREAGEIVPGEKVRDVAIENSDYIAIILDTYLDRQNGFVFATTPAAVEYDGQVVREGEGGGVQQSGQSRAQAGSMGGFNLNWDGTWSVRTSSDSIGWYAEFRIPFSTLRYGGGSRQQWGLNVARGIRRKGEDAYCPSFPASSICTGSRAPGPSLFRACRCTGWPWSLPSCSAPASATQPISRCGGPPHRARSSERTPRSA